MGGSFSVRRKSFVYEAGACRPAVGCCWARGQPGQLWERACLPRSRVRTGPPFLSLQLSLAASMSRLHCPRPTSHAGLQSRAARALRTDPWRSLLLPDRGHAHHIRLHAVVRAGPRRDRQHACRRTAAAHARLVHGLVAPPVNGKDELPPGICSAGMRQYAGPDAPAASSGAEPSGARICAPRRSRSETSPGASLRAP